MSDSNLVMFNEFEVKPIALYSYINDVKTLVGYYPWLHLNGKQMKSAVPGNKLGGFPGNEQLAKTPEEAMEIYMKYITKRQEELANVR